MNDLTTKTDIAALLTALTMSETAFADGLFALVRNGHLTQDEFREAIIGARAAAYDDGVEGQYEYQCQVNAARKAKAKRAAL